MMKCVKSICQPGRNTGCVLVQREHLLDQDEHHARAEQVEDEPVEADIGRVVGEVVDRHAMAAHRHGEQPISASAVPLSQRLRSRIRLAIARPPAITMPTSRISRRTLTSYCLAQIRRRQVLREMEGEHRQDRQSAQRQGDHPGDLAVSDFDPAGLMEDGGGFANDRRVHARIVTYRPKSTRFPACIVRFTDSRRRRARRSLVVSVQSQAFMRDCIRLPRTCGWSGARAHSRA